MIAPSDPKPMPGMQSKPAKNKSGYAYNFLNIDALWQTPSTVERCGAQ